MPVSGTFPRRGASKRGMTFDEDLAQLGADLPPLDDDAAEDAECRRRWNEWVRQRPARWRVAELHGWPTRIRT